MESTRKRTVSGYLPTNKSSKKSRSSLNECRFVRASNFRASPAWPSSPQACRGRGCRSWQEGPEARAQGRSLLSAHLHSLKPRQRGHSQGFLPTTNHTVCLPGTPQRSSGKRGEWGSRSQDCSASVPKEGANSLLLLVPRYWLLVKVCLQSPGMWQKCFGGQATRARGCRCEGGAAYHPAAPPLQAP